MTANFIGAYQNERPKIYNQGLFEESSTQKHRLGTIRVLDDGRRFVYAQATAAALAAGVCVSKAVAPQALTIAAADATQNIAGAQKLYFTVSGTPTLNQYRDGYLIISAGSGELGPMYKVRGNSADDNPASGRFTVYLYDKLYEGLTASTTTADIFANPYDGVLINPAVANGDATTGERILGVTTREVTASYYFWAQTWGLASVILDASTAGAEADERVLVPGSTEGRLLVSAAGAENDQQVYGHPMETADQDDGEAALVFLTIS